MWDVFCISTGAMFSSGLFLLPGLATAQSGPSAVLAYLAAGLLMLPAMFCIAELATALPRAGGAYFFVERSLGPAFGSVTGIGAWLALVLKSAFALVGMGAYLATMPGLAEHVTVDSQGTIWLIKVIALVLTVVFVATNILGAKQTAMMQQVLVLAILGVMGFFIVQGLWYVFVQMPQGALGDRYTPFLHQEHGITGWFATIGLVFVSYSGLTKVASVSEEVKHPERNLPLGMILALMVTSTVYVVAVFIIIAVLDPEPLRGDLAPVATAAKAFFDWLPWELGTIIVIIAAFAAFASTGNAGILSASRYPLAMARDSLVPPALGALGRFGSPARAILMTGGAIMFCIVVLSAEGVAKLGSTFNLLVLGLLNLAVIVMRESRIEGYDPSFRVPLYPWIPLGGIVISIVLIAEMGWFTSVVSVAVIILSLVWYTYYARPRVERYGAIHHVFARLGAFRYARLDAEFREIIREKGLRTGDPYDEIVEAADLIDVEPGLTIDEVVMEAADLLAKRVPLSKDEIAGHLTEAAHFSGAPFSHGVALIHFRSDSITEPQLVLARAREGIHLSVPVPSNPPTGIDEPQLHVVFFLASPGDKPGQHLRLLAKLAEHAENRPFIDAWRRIDDPEQLKRTLYRDVDFLEVRVGASPATAELAGLRIGDLGLPPDTRVVTVRRGDLWFEPRSRFVVNEGDVLAVVGEPQAIIALQQRFNGDEEPARP